MVTLARNPQAWAQRQGIDRGLYDSVINKTPLSARTNRIISGDAPSVYLPKLQKRGGTTEARMDQILASHVVNPSDLRADDFHGFFAARQEALLQRIEAAMGKPIARDIAEPYEPAADIGDQTDEEDEDAPTA